MSRPAVCWRDVERYLLRNGYIITGSGGDKIIKAPQGSADAKRTRNQVLIGHKCCSNGGSEVWDSYLSAIKRAFGVTREQILAGE